MNRNALFLSVDISGSTSFKHSKKYWMQPIITIVDEISNSFEAEGFTVWKFLGDEVLFYKMYNSKNILEDIQAILKVSRDFNQKSLDLKIKCTSWTANFDDAGLLNRAFLINKSLDFLGRHVDFGFRLTPSSKSDTFIVDPVIAFELSNLAVADLGVKKIRMKKLKGIENPCPIFKIVEKKVVNNTKEMQEFIDCLDDIEKAPHESIFSSNLDSLEIEPPIPAGLVQLESVTYSRAMFAVHGLQINDVIDFLRRQKYPEGRSSGREIIPIEVGNVTFIIGIDLRYKTATVEYVVMKVF